MLRKILQPLLTQRLACLHRQTFLSTTSRAVHTDPGLALQYEDDVAIIHMDNKRDNRINRHFLKEFHSLLDSVEGNQKCKGLITMGEGKFYSNGLDTDWMTTISATELLEFMNYFHEVLVKILFFPMPTLAVLNGHTFAGGAMLAFAHDLRTMNSEKGWLCFNEVFLNKRASPFMKEYLRIKLGGGKNVSDALVLGRRYTAIDAYNNHLVHSVNPQLSLFNHSLQILQSFYGRDGYPRTGMLNMKKDIYKIPLEAFEKESEEKKPYFAVQFMTQAQLSSLEKL